MSKADETKAFDQFIKKLETIKASEGDTYFEDLIDAQDLIRRNISNDFFAFIGAFTTNATVSAKVKSLTAQTEDLKTRVEDLAQWDVRMLKRKLAEVDADMEACAKEREGMVEERNAITLKLNG